MPDVERDLAAVMRRYRARKQSLEELEDERDELIRAAMEANIPRRRIAELTELSLQRLHQIRRGVRV